MIVSNNPEGQAIKGQLGQEIEQKAIGNIRLLKVDRKIVRLSMMHRSLGALTFTNHKQGTGHGTAILISKNLIFTAAHNIYSRDGNRSAEHTDFKFYLGASGEEYKTCHADTKGSLDYAIMQLQTDIQQPIKYKNFCQIALTCKICGIQDMDKLDLQIYGYPLIRQNFQPLDKSGKMMIHQFGLTKYEKAVEKIDFEQGKIYYNISTLPGQSGCGVISKGNIIAVHVGSHSSEESNIGRLITLDVVSNLHKWCKQIQGDWLSININSLCEHNRSHQIIKEIINGNQHCKQKQQRQIPSEQQSSDQQKPISQYKLTPGGEQFDRNSISKIKDAFFRKAYKLLEQQQNLEDSLQKYKQCLAYQEQLEDHKIQSSFTLLQIGNIYSELRKYSLAISSYKKSIQIREANNEKDSTYILIITNLANVYQKKGKYTQAIKYYQHALRFAKQNKEKEYMEQCERGIKQCTKIIKQSLKQLKRLRKQQG